MWFCVTANAQNLGVILIYRVYVPATTTGMRDQHTIDPWLLKNTAYTSRNNNTLRQDRFRGVVCVT